MKPILGSQRPAGGRRGPGPPPRAPAAAVVVTTGPPPHQKSTSRPTRTIDGRYHHHRWLSVPPRAPGSPGDTALEAGPPASPGSTPVPAAAIAAAAVIAGHTASSESRAAHAAPSRPHRLTCIPDDSSPSPPDVSLPWGLCRCAEDTLGSAPLAASEEKISRERAVARSGAPRYLRLNRYPRPRFPCVLAGFSRMVHA